jgi:hypothetical protein
MSISRGSVAEIYCPVSGSVGSGYFCTSRLVLTAQHVVSGAVLNAAPPVILPSAHAEELIRTRAKSPALCRVRSLAAGAGAAFLDAVPVWWSAAADVVLLVLVDPRAASASVPPITWSEIPESDPIDVNAVGFPQADTTEGVRESRQISGQLNPLSGVKSGRFVIHINESIGRVPANASSSWEGISGAALFAGDVLVGLILVDADAAHPERLELWALPAKTFADDPVFVSWTCWDGGEGSWERSKELASSEIALRLERSRDKTVESDLRDYLGALEQYSDSAYRVLAARFPAGLTLENVYVPLRGKAAGQAMLLADALHFLCGIPRSRDRKNV